MSEYWTVMGYILMITVIMLVVMWLLFKSVDRPNIVKETNKNCTSCNEKLSVKALYCDNCGLYLSGKTYKVKASELLNNFE